MGNLSNLKSPPSQILCKILKGVPSQSPKIRYVQPLKIVEHTLILRYTKVV
mgnify:FL=1